MIEAGSDGALKELRGRVVGYYAVLVGCDYAAKAQRRELKTVR